MQHWADYLIFGLFIVISLGIGVYHGCTGGKQSTTEEFIMGNRQLKLIPTAMSLLMTYQSAIVILGSSAEMYDFGPKDWPMWILGFWIALLLAERFCVPWIYPLKLTSINKYFKLRYGDGEIRAFACVLGIVNGIMYMGVSVFAPAVALETATGFSVMTSIPVMSVLCIVYTAVGGMRAVIWTDVFQTVVMLIGMLVILIKSMMLVSGAVNAFQLIKEAGRDEWIDISPDPRSRMSLWAIIFGWGLQFGCVYGLQQASVQRYSALPTLRKARLSLLLNMPFLAITVTLANLSAISVVGYYAYTKCDPIQSGRITASNGILPLFVKEVFGNAPGFGGMFLATLFSGALSSVSSSLSGCAANFWEDIIAARFQGISEKRAVLLNKIFVVLFGLLSTGMAFLSATMTGPVTQIAMAFFGVCGGPLLGLFLTSGIKAFRFVRSRALLCGGMLGLAVNLWISISAGFLPGKYPTLHPLSVEGCETPVNFTENLLPEIEGINKLYTLSYLWYPIVGMLVTMIVGLGISAIMNAVDKKRIVEDIPDKLFIPFGQIFSFGETDYQSVPKNTDNEIPMTER